MFEKLILKNKNGSELGEKLAQKREEIEELKNTVTYLKAQVVKQTEVECKLYQENLKLKANLLKIESEHDNELNEEKLKHAREIQTLSEKLNALEKRLEKKNEQSSISLQPYRQRGQRLGQLELTQAQTDELERVWSYTQNPALYQQKTLARTTGLSEAHIQLWFEQMRRAERNAQRNEGAVSTNQYLSSGARDESTDEWTLAIIQQKGLTQTQTEWLERAFNTSHYLSTIDRQTLARRIGMTVEQVNVWFQNRRSQWRRERDANI